MRKKRGSDMKGLKFWEMCSAVIFLGGALMFGAGCLLDATLSSPWCAAGGTAVIVSIALPLLSAFSWSAVLSLGQKTILSMVRMQHGGGNTEERREEGY